MLVKEIHILVTGASGSGTSTLAAVLAAELQAVHIEVDDYFWEKTDPPYQIRRSPEDRLNNLLSDLSSKPKTVCAGSVSGWGSELEEKFDLVVFLYLKAAIRLERLRAREMARFGRVDPKFLDWAAQYDEGPPEGRSFTKQDLWLKSRACPVLRLVGDLSVEERSRKVREFLASTTLAQYDKEGR
jgi:energy-coupling factor transporter ATP-binding protein EcfA2